MGYQESWVYIEPQRKFEKLIRAYEKAEQSGYYNVAGAEPCSVIILKRPFGDIPAGKKLLWPWFPLRRGDIRRRTEMFRQTPRDPCGGSAEQCGRSTYERAGLEQSGPQRK